MEGTTAMTVSAFLENVSTVLGQCITWVGNVINTITGTPVLLAIFCIGFAPLAIHWAKMLLNLSQN